MEILEFNPTGLEGIDHLLFKFVKDKGDENANLALLPPGGGFLLVEFGGDSKEDSRRSGPRTDGHAEDRQAPMPPSMKLYRRPGAGGDDLEGPRGLAGLDRMGARACPTRGKVGKTRRCPCRTSPIISATCASCWTNTTITRRFTAISGKAAFTRASRSICTPPKASQKWRSFIDEATDLVVKYGGSFSGEHGDGQSRGEWLPKMFGPELMEAMREFKQIWDPQWKMNPGKIIDPYTMTENLRLGPDYNPPSPRRISSIQPTVIRFARARLRCVGVGECRRRAAGPCAPATWSRAKRSIPPAAARGCSSK